MKRMSGLLSKKKSTGQTDDMQNNDQLLEQHDQEEEKKDAQFLYSRIHRSSISIQIDDAM